MRLTYFTGKIFLFVTIIILSAHVSWGARSELTLALADSTCDTMKKAGELFTQQTGIKLNYVCHASGLLAQGIKEGAIVADYFLSASKRWMNDVADAGYVDPDDIREQWSNQLVVSYFPSKMGDLPVQDLDSLLTPTVKMVLIGDPAIAPYGMYAKQALVNAEMWEKIQSKLKINAKISLSIRSLKKLSLTTPGIVAFLYRTNVSDKMKIHFAVPQNLYPRINYFSAPLIRATQKEEMTMFLDFVRGEEASSIFRSAGFVVNLPPGRQN